MDQDAIIDNARECLWNPEFFLYIKLIFYSVQTMIFIEWWSIVQSTNRRRNIASTTQRVGHDTWSYSARCHVSQVTQYNVIQTLHPPLKLHNLSLSATTFPTSLCVAFTTCGIMKWHCGTQYLSSVNQYVFHTTTKTVSFKKKYYS